MPRGKGKPKEEPSSPKPEPEPPKEEAEEAKKEEEAEGDEKEGEEEEVKAPPTHDPFPLPILQLVTTAQAQNGLRHNDHHRYRQYCYRRLQRIRKALKFHHGRGRYKSAPLPEFYVDPKFLYIPLVAAERAWAYGMQIKSDNATSSHVSARSRAHAMRRFGKAVKLAEELKAQVAKHGDARSQKEASAYLAFLTACYATEREQWTEANSALSECQAAYEHLALTAEGDAGVYRAKVKELAPMLRLCTYHLGVRGEEAGVAAAVEADMKVTYRGVSVPVVSAEVQAAVQEGQKAVAEADVHAEKTVEKYGTIVQTLEDALAKVHAAMVVDADGGAAQAKQLKLLEAYLR